MMTAQSAITRFRRDLTLSTLIKVVMLVGVVVCLAHGMDSVAVFVALGALWLLLSYRSVKSSRFMAAAPALIATGQFELAEKQIETSLRSFSMFRTAKLLSLHHMALLRHAQQRWSEAAALCLALLRQRLGGARQLNKSTRLILADAMLALDDNAGAYSAMAGLYPQKLTLAEAQKLLSIQLDYESRLGAWTHMVEALPAKVQLAELMPTPDAARTQAFLALAAMHAGMMDWCQWLRCRVELLVEPRQLCGDRPILEVLWRDSSAG